MCVYKMCNLPHINYKCWTILHIIMHNLPPFECVKSTVLPVSLKLAGVTVGGGGGVCTYQQPVSRGVVVCVCIPKASVRGVHTNSQCVGGQVQSLEVSMEESPGLDTVRITQGLLLILLIQIRQPFNELQKETHFTCTIYHVTYMQPLISTTNI